MRRAALTGWLLGRPPVTRGAGSPPSAWRLSGPAHPPAGRGLCSCRPLLGRRPPPGWVCRPLAVRPGLTPAGAERGACGGWPAAPGSVSQKRGHAGGGGPGRPSGRRAVPPTAAQLRGRPPRSQRRRRGRVPAKSRMEGGNWHPRAGQDTAGGVTERGPRWQSSTGISRLREKCCPWHSQRRGKIFRRGECHRPRSTARGP